MKKSLLLIIFIFLASSINIFSQIEIEQSQLPLFIKDYDLSTINIDQLSDEEISKIIDELEKNNTTLEMLEPVAISNGISIENFEKLESRILQFLSVQDLRDIDSETLSNEDPIFNQFRSKNKLGNKKVKEKLLKDEIFGSELFNKVNNINLKSIIPPPQNYIIGPGDDLQINIYGVQQLSVNVKVLSDGNINIPNVGYIPISGLTIENSAKKLKNDLSNIYRSLNNNSSNLSINISKVRSINVTITGSNYPGVYTLSAANSIYDAVQLAGGPSNKGSFRKIELIRNGKVINTLDLYEFMTSPNQKSNISLSNNDVIRIPTFINQIRVIGEVKRPGIFELKKDENLSDLIAYSSGFTNNAYTDEVKIVQKTNNQFRLEEVEKKMFHSYYPKDGDVIEVGKILNRYENRVHIKGAVFRPGQFSLNYGMRVMDLINKAEGLSENANFYNARILRRNKDLTRKSISLKLNEVIDLIPSSNIELQNEDIVEIFENDFDEFTVELNGMIFKPGKYIFNEGLTLGDIISKSGGLLANSSGIVEIARKTKSSNENILSETFVLNFNDHQDFKLNKYDVINVRQLDSERFPEFIKIEGAVKTPGFYAIENFKNQVDYYIQKANGLSANADVNGIKIIRKIELKQIVSDSLLNNNKDINNENEIANSIAIKYKEIVIPINYKKVGSASKVVLKGGDILKVETINYNVSISGEVQLDSEIPFKKGLGLKYYLKAVGGKNRLSDLSNAYVIYPNGQAKSTSNFIFLKFFPKIKEGSQIIIPKKTERSKTSVGELIGYTSALSSVAAIIISVFK